MESKYEILWADQYIPKYSTVLKLSIITVASGIKSRMVMSPLQLTAGEMTKLERKRRATMIWQDGATTRGSLAQSYSFNISLTMGSSGTRGEYKSGCRKPGEVE